MWTLTPAEYALTVEKIAKINTRAIARGFTGRIEITGTETTVTNTVNGFKIIEQMIETEISGEAPSYNGWTFAATLDWDENADALIVRTSPGVESIDRSTVREGYCDHCRTHRTRKNTYLLRNENGRQIQVGSTCIKDFLGWNALPVFISTSDIEKEIDDLGGSFRSSDSSLATDSVLAVAWAAVKVYGWKPASSYDSTTRDDVSTFFYGKGKGAAEVRADLESVATESADHAAEIRTFILSDAFTGDNEYVRNLKAILSAEYVSARNLGIVVSAPQAFAKAQERTLLREKAQTVEAYIGAVGDKITISGTITNIRWIEGQYGTTTLYTITTDQGTVKWFASRAALGETQGVDVTVKATVKNHEDYRGHLSTLITRAKLI